MHFTTNIGARVPDGTDAANVETIVNNLGGDVDTWLGANSQRLGTGLLNSISKACNALTALGTSLADVPNCTTTFSVTGAHAFALVVGTFDFSKTAVAAQAVGALVVDGVAQPAQATFSDFANTISERDTVGQSWVVALAAGSHTLKLQASRTPGAGTVNVQNVHTTMSVLVIDLP